MGNNSGFRIIARIHLTVRRNISVFQSGKSKVLDQGLGSVFYSTMDMESHANSIVCGSNCIVMHFTGKECDVAPYTDEYKTIKAVPIAQAATAYSNPETGETPILILHEAIWMGETMDHTLVNTNELRAYMMTFQDYPFVEAPIFIATEDHEFMILFSSKGNILGVSTRSPTNKKLQN